MAALLVIDPERLTIPHFLRVVRDRLRDIGNVDSNVIHHDHTTIGDLRHPYLDCQPHEKPSPKEHCTTHTAS